MVPSPWVFTARKRDVGAADFDRRPYVSLERQGKATPPGLATGPKPWIEKEWFFTVWRGRWASPD